MTVQSITVAKIVHIRLTIVYLLQCYMPLFRNTLTTEMPSPPIERFLFSLLSAFLSVILSILLNIITFQVSFDLGAFKVSVYLKLTF